MTVPSLSIVLTGRNDNYGGDFNERFFSALQFNLDRLCEHGVSCEVVIVEWNPVAGRRFLCELLTGHVRLGAGTSLTRIVAAREYHAAMTQNPRLDYLEYVAKNVGIRRAAAPWILATNTDVLFGRTVVEALARGDLSAGTVYRAPRYDIKLGADVTLAEDRPTVRLSDRPMSCFAATVGGEVLAAGRKLIGSAQVRRGAAFLQHGSILLDGSNDTPNATTLRQVLGRPVTFEEVTAAIMTAWAEPLGSGRDLAPLAAG